MTNQRMGKNGIVIFDGSCGACSTLIGQRRAFFEKHGFMVAPFQESWVGELTGFDDIAFSQAIYLYTPTGNVYRGIDVFQHVAEKVWWLVPVSVLLRIGWLKPLFVKLYEVTAKRRKRISKICGLQSRALYK